MAKRWEDFMRYVLGNVQASPVMQLETYQQGITFFGFVYENERTLWFWVGQGGFCSQWTDSATPPEQPPESGFHWYDDDDLVIGLNVDIDLETQAKGADT